MENTNDKKSYRAAEIQLTYKTQVKISERPKVTSSKDSFGVFMDSWDEDQLDFIEQFKVLLLNRAHRVLGIVLVSSGSSTGTVVDPKIVFASALMANACCVVLAHNHPSGNLQPSQADIDLTRKLKEGGKLLEVQVLDHLIVTREGYYSFADEGLW